VEQLLLGRVAVAHEGVPHAGRWRVSVVLPAAGPRRPVPGHHGAPSVDHVALQHAVLDQDRALGGGALIVVLRGAPGVRDRAVVHVRDRRASDLLSQLVREHRRVPSDRGRLQQVTEGLVEDDAAERVADHDRHGACRRLASSEVGECDLRGSPAGLGGWVHVEELEADRETGTDVGRLRLVSFARDGLHDQAGPGAVVRGDHTVGVGDQHLLLDLVQVRLDLAYGRIDACAGVRLAQALQAPPFVVSVRCDLGAGQVWSGVQPTQVQAAFAGGVGTAVAAAAPHGDEAVQYLSQPGVREVVGEAVEHIVPEEEAYAGATLHDAGRVLDLPVDGAYASFAPALGVYLGEVGASRSAARDYRAQGVGT